MLSIINFFDRIISCNYPTVINDSGMDASIWEKHSRYGHQRWKINGLNMFLLQFYTAKESLFLISLLDKSKTSTEMVELFAYENNWNKYDTSSLSP